MAVVKAVKPLPMLCLDIEIAVARFFGYRDNLIVPNITWGLGFTHELDVLVMSRAGYVTEVEIKTSAQDLKRDLLKRHGHRSTRIRNHYLAVPENLVELGLATFPPHWGVLKVNFRENGGGCWSVRMPKTNKEAKPLMAKEITHLYELASMRVWTLKETLAQRINRSRLRQEK